MPGPDLLETLGRMAASVLPVGNAATKLVDELKPWMQTLLAQAAPKWLPRIMAGLPCQVPVFRKGKRSGSCKRNAVATCDVCQSLCCLGHARIDQHGDAICMMCVAEAVAQKRGRANAAGEQPPDEEDLAAARRTLGVNKDSTWDEIRTAMRKKSAKWHPDAHRGAQAKKDAEERFKKVQRAYDLLKREHEAKEAA